MTSKESERQASQLTEKQKGRKRRKKPPFKARLSTFLARIGRKKVDECLKNEEILANGESRKMLLSPKEQFYSLLEPWNMLIQGL